MVPLKGNIFSQNVTKKGSLKVLRLSKIDNLEQNMNKNFFNSLKKKPTYFFSL